jgi:hypothetical protein
MCWFLARLKRSSFIFTDILRIFSRYFPDRPVMPASGAVMFAGKSGSKRSVGRRLRQTGVEGQGGALYRG